MEILKCTAQRDEKNNQIINTSHSAWLGFDSLIGGKVTLASYKTENKGALTDSRLPFACGFGLNFTRFIIRIVQVPSIFYSKELFS